MLADYELDTEQFQDIMDDAKNMAVSLYPEWTDFNYHDPGITLLELFSWVKEGQQYFLDQIGDAHKRNYLKLLGVSPYWRKPAKTYIHISAERTICLPKGTPVGTAEVPFETARRQCIADSRIRFCFHGKEALEHTCVGESHLRLPVFGTEPDAGDAWYIGFDRPLPQEETVGICLWFAEAPDGIKKRNPLHAPLYMPLFSLAFEYFTGGAWREIERVEDHTYGMLQSGMLYLTVSYEMEETDVFGKRAHFIRIRVIKSNYDVPPVLERIQMNVAQAVQLDTWAEAEEMQAVRVGDRYVAYAGTSAGITGAGDLYVRRGDVYYPVAVSEKYPQAGAAGAKWLFSLPPGKETPHGKEGQDAGSLPVLAVSYPERPGFQKCLGIGTGLPYQEMELPSEDILYESVEILVAEIGTANGYCRWKRVRDFGASAPADKHFTVDTGRARICFGDCEHGMAPEGPVYLISFAATKGPEGNVTRGTLDAVWETADGTFAAANESDAEGGTAEETAEECFLRARRMLKRPKTAVTCADYERHVMETPGLLLAGCKALPAPEAEGNALSIVVRPACFPGARRELSEAYRKNILAHLERYRMLGTQIRLLPPRFISLEVTLDVMAKPHFLRAKETICKMVEQYFAALQEQFGAAVVYSDLYGAVDRLDCVASVSGLTLDVRDGRAVRTRDGNILLPPNGVIELKNIHCTMSMSSAD